MERKHIVRLTARQRKVTEQVVTQLDGSPQKVRRAEILLKADCNQAGWTDVAIAEAYGCSHRTVESVRKRFCEVGFEATLHGKKRSTPPRSPKLDGHGEAQVIALRLSKPPKGYANWTLDLLQERVIALSIVDSISRETLRKTLKKMG